MFFSGDDVFTQTVLQRGNLAILAVNANLPFPNSSRNEISFVCFKDIANGTEIQLLDAGYENYMPRQWSGGQKGGAVLRRTGGTIPAGTVITFRTTTPYLFISPDNSWAVSSLYDHPKSNYALLSAQFNLNSGGDQMYFAQNGS